MSKSGEIDAAIRELKEGFAVETDRQLADRLQIDPSAIAAWRRRNKLPEKYRLRLLRMVDESLSGNNSYNSYYKLLDAYSFSLVARAAEILHASITISGADMDVFVGFRLRKLYAFVSKELGSAASQDKDSLRAKFEALRAELDQDNVFEWIEGLPDPL